MFQLEIFQDLKDKWKKKVQTEGSFYSLQSVASSDTEVWDEIISEPTDDISEKETRSKSFSIDNILKQKRNRFGSLKCQSLDT